MSLLNDTKDKAASDERLPCDAKIDEEIGEVISAQSNAGYHRNFTPRQIHVWMYIHMNNIYPLRIMNIEMNH